LKSWNSLPDARARLSIKYLDFKAKYLDFIGQTQIAL